MNYIMLIAGALGSLFVLRISIEMVKQEVHEDSIQIRAEKMLRDGTFDDHSRDVWQYLLAAFLDAATLAGAVWFISGNALAFPSVLASTLLIPLTTRTLYFNVLLNEKMNWPTWYFSDRGTDRILSKIILAIPEGIRFDVFLVIQAAVVVLNAFIISLF